ncbi:Ig-like domain-containing protein [Aeromicrobium massiliense]|uniref:Ig-like domain-containing protein n=1 Tax=Aeromicrobium massiliense TaxID=1464554 RepID=UPI00031F16D6|nr:Ig-like domain-containing protein [Aeromicrobium massiliense]
MTSPGWTKKTAAALGGLLATAVLVPLSPPAQADFAAQCASPTRALDGNRSAPITLAAGETLLLTAGTFTGGVDAFPAGSTLCVSPSATFDPGYVNNAAGALVVASGGEVTLPSMVAATGFSLENEGTVTAQTLNINGTARIRNLASGTLVIRDAFSPATGAVINDGEMEVRAGYRINESASLENNGALLVRSALIVDGRLQNAGAVAAEAVEVNGSSSLHNQCVLVAQGSLRNDSATSLNEGFVLSGATFTNNGTWRQTLAGAVLATGLSNDGTVNGFGRYRISGTTRTQGTFTGDSPASPIVVNDTTPPTPPQIFDQQSGTVANVVAAAFSSIPADDYPTPSCAGTNVRPSADLDVSKSGPSTVLAGDTVTYTIRVTNIGPSAAEDVEIGDQLPAGLTNVTVSDGGTVGSGEAAWELGTVAAGQTVTLTVTGTAPASGTLVNGVTGTSTTPDPHPGNNNGISPSAKVTTEVAAPIPVNAPPVASPATYDTLVDRGTAHRLGVSDPDDGQQLRTTLQSGPSNGRAVVLPSGVFTYVPDEGFTGTDTFTYEVCDNFDPAACDTATITMNVRPVAVDDVAQTTLNTPVTVTEQVNDLGDGVTVTIVDPPSNGVALVQPDGSIRYTPAPGYEGTDNLTYRICSVDNPALCDDAEVDLLVRSANNPPTVPDELLRTVTERPVDGTLRGTDPDGDAVSYVVARDPRNGTATVTGSGVTYTPKAGFSGRDDMSVIVCDDGAPSLCASGTVSFEVSPLATDDRARTQPGRPVALDSLANDKGSVGAPVVVDDPSDGTVVWRDGRFVYTPEDGFTGTDRFTYRICSAGPDPLCAEAEDTIVVAAAPAPDDGGTPGDEGSGGPGDPGDGGSLPGGLPDAGGPAGWIAALGGLLLAGGAWLMRRRVRPVTA